MKKPTKLILIICSQERPSTLSEVGLTSPSQTGYQIVEHIWNTFETDFIFSFFSIQERPSTTSMIANSLMSPAAFSQLPSVIPFSQIPQQQQHQQQQQPSINNALTKEQFQQAFIHMLQVRLCYVLLRLHYILSRLCYILSRLSYICRGYVTFC